MGRKKKRPAAKESSRSGPTTAVQVESPPVAVEEFLSLRLLPPPSTASGNRDYQKEQLIYLTDQDVYRIDVIGGDKVLVLAREGEEMAVASAVCSVRITTDGVTPSKLSSPGTRGTPVGKQSVRLSQGNCRVSPAFLAAFLCLSDDGGDDESGEGAVSSTFKTISTTSSTVTASPVTPSKALFSFARGGGGDALISPSSSVKTAKSPRTPLRSSQSIIVVPLHNGLGRYLLEMFNRDASTMSLRLLSDVDDTAWSNSQRVIQRLVLANHSGRLLHKGDVIGISFQGKAMELRVECVKTELSTHSIEDLSDRVAGMNLNSSVDGRESLVESIRCGLQQDECKRRLCLFEVTSTTNVILLPNQVKVSNDDALQESRNVKSQESDSPSRVVAGLDSTLEQVKSLLLPPLLRSDLFKNHSLRPPRGVLLHGPAGVGKSLLAQQIQQDLQSQVHVKSISCASFQSQTAIVGEAERALSRLFDSVQRNHDKPGTLLILDDIHLICPKRGGRQHLGEDRLAATLLALLDGIKISTENDDRGNLMILGITSNPSLLDPALRRPGRLDAEFEVPIPDEVSRAEIFEFQLERLATSISMVELDKSDYVALSRLAKGFNGADVMLAIKEALRRAIGEAADPNAVTMTKEHLEASIRSTKPSTISSITVEIPQVHWTSIGGMEPVKRKLREAIELPVTHSHLFEALNIPPPRGVLLYGPPGCSKTLMARALATEGQMNFLAVKGPELLSKWLGESERALASLFRRARMASPCIIFFDEVDAIASKRGGGEGGAGGERLLSQLLTELDGIGNSTTLGTGKQERVIVVGATNRPDLLDSALTRPGRIDRMIYVGLPDQSSRARIFEIGLRGKACSDDIDVSRVQRSALQCFRARQTSSNALVSLVQFSILSSDHMSGGFSGAEIIAICREAALLAIEEDDESMEDSSSPQIAIRHLTRAISEMQRQVTPEMLEFYASFNTKATI